jgi:hypothetical protein
MYFTLFTKSVPLLLPGLMAQFALSEATLLGWRSMEEDGLCAGSKQGSVAHLSETNQESITSRGTGLQTWPQHTTNRAAILLDL